MNGRPSLLDNLDGNTHKEGLSYLLNDVPEKYTLSIATGYVNLGGLHHIAVIVTDQREVRLLLGAEPDPGLSSGKLPPAQFEQSLDWLLKERNLASFPRSRKARRLLELDDWLQKPNVQVRRYVKEFLHGKVYLFGDRSDARAVMVTSANLTAAGLERNRELGLVDYNTEPANNAVIWFDNLWSEAVEYKTDLRELLFPDPGLIDPRDIYLRALLELFGTETDLSERNTPRKIHLADFQLDGFNRALNIVREHHGVIYADGVGTGKTEIGLSFIEEYALGQGQRALVVAPRQLVEHWQRRLSETNLPAQVVSYHEFANDEQIADKDASRPKRNLHSDKDAYRLVLVDEGHALRNPGNTWHQAMTRMMGGERKYLVLLTATPINNGLWDMYHLVMTFAQHDTAFAGYGIRSLRDLFQRAGANAVNTEHLNPDILFPLADMVSVRRDRRLIRERWPEARFPDGKPVRFPNPHLTTERYDLDAAHPNLVRDITRLIERMTMARYRPSYYRIGEDEAPNEVNLGGLIKTAVLKRFESCWEACLNTVTTMMEVHQVFLDAWEQGVVPSRGALQDARKIVQDEETGITEWMAETLESEDSEPVSLFDPKYRSDVAEDLECLKEIRKRLAAITPEADPKLVLLRRLLEDSPSQKVIVFSTFADTISYLDEHLPALVGGRKRVTVIGADTTPDDRMRQLGRFCPETVVQPGYEPPEGEVDLLLCNDVLSEGQNLQQAAAAISYDMPWNPQRVVQRYGRVVRLLSPHNDVYLTTMLPEEGDLEELLRLETTIRHKVVAARPYGMEIEIVEGIDEQVRVYTEKLARGDPSLLDDADSTAGFEAFSSELLRAELRRAWEEGEVDRIRELPWGVGTAFRQGEGVPSTGPSGYFFACRINDDEGERYWRYVTKDSVLGEPATILRRINPGNAPQHDLSAIDLDIDLEEAWCRASDSIVKEHNDLAEKGDISIGPIQQWALNLLADPTVPSPPGASQASKALSVGRGNLVRTELGSIRRDLKDKQITPTGAARKIVEVVQNFGLREVDQPPRLTKITQDDIGVVCWMAVLPSVSDI